MKQHQPALRCLTRLVKKQEKKKTKTKKNFLLPLTSLFSCIFSLIAIAILQTQTPAPNISFSSLFYSLRLQLLSVTNSNFFTKLSFRPSHNICPIISPGPLTPPVV
jgi:hypothetical protein